MTIETSGAFDCARGFSGVIECLACHAPATVKDYRSHGGTVDGYPACLKHYGFDDRNFWKAVKQKEIGGK